MATILDMLADILNPNPGQNRLVAPNANGPNYLTQTGLSQDQLARFHQMSGMGGQAAPATTMPQEAPPAAIGQPQAPQPDQVQTAAVAPPQAEGGGFLSRLFGGGQSAGESQTIQWLQQQGMDPGTATMMARSKPILQQYLLQRSQGEKPIEIAGKLVNPRTFEVLADFSTPKEADKPPTSYQEYELAKQDGSFKGDYTAWQTKSTRDQDPTFAHEEAIRTKYDVDPNTLSYKKVRDSYERIRIGVADPSGPNDVNIVYGYMKMLDPGAAVMVNDQATAQNAGGVSENIRNLYNQALTGESLSPEVRKQFLASADKLYAEAAKNLADTNTRYEGIAKGWQLDPSRIVQTPEAYDPLMVDAPPPAATATGLPLPPAPVAPAAPGGPAPDRFAPDIPTDQNGRVVAQPGAPTADGWREVAPGVKLRKVN